MDLSSLKAGMNRLAGAVKRTGTTTPLMWGEWAVVEDPNLPSVVLESDWQKTPRPVRNAAGRLEQYQRVYVLHQGPITTIIANPGRTTAWTKPLLMNGWENYGRTYGPAAYRLEESGVRLSGLIRHGQVDMPAFVLPEGPPLERLLQATTYTNSTVTPCRVSVNMRGEVIPSTGANPVWVSLDGLFIPY